jgi:hypothetical protein
MRYVGVLKREYEELALKLLLATHSNDKQKLSVDLYDVMPIFVILAVGIASSLAFFLVETYRGSFFALK